jgi:HK97 gp10 family phage protein
MAAIDVKINKQDMLKLVKKIDELKQLSKQDLSKNIAHAAIDIANNAAQAAPVANMFGGTLKQSIGSEAKGNTAVIYAKTKYAAYQEFGTGTFVDVKQATALGIPASEIKRLYKGEGKRKVNIQPQPYFFPAVRKGLKKLLTNIENDIKNIIK